MISIYHHMKSSALFPFTKPLTLLPSFIYNPSSTTKDVWSYINPYQVYIEIHLTKYKHGKNSITKRGAID